MISIVIPSYGRSDRIWERVRNAHEATTEHHEVVVVVEMSQIKEYMHAVPHEPWLDIVGNERTANYAGAVNTAMGYVARFSDYVFLAADDLNFEDGWDQPALAVMESLDTVKVVGTNDLLNGYVLNGWHATHYLVDRGYIEEPGGCVDGPSGCVLFEGYDHNYTDTEFIGTAKARAVFAPCLASVVEHLHPTVGKGPSDATFQKTQLNLQSDHDLYHSRKHLWWELSK